ncbi:MAG TPA: response regulator transcription factor [Candidatus Desulfofervidus auxilii]|nr:response regulator transcription factor [Candidatus Desulfofervidus auxilii]
MTIKRDILALKKNFPKAKIIFLSLRDIRGDMELNVIKMGAKGFLCAKDSLKTLIQAIKSCYNGEIWATRRSTNIIIDNLQGKIITRKKDEVDILTPQEKKVLILLASGFKNAEIAQKLFISEKTVKTHINKIFKKIKVTNRLQAALWASKNLSRT